MTAAWETDDCRRPWRALADICDGRNAGSFYETLRRQQSVQVVLRWTYVHCTDTVYRVRWARQSLSFESTLKIFGKDHQPVSSARKTLRTPTDERARDA
ncbi:hypothetical protein GCM10007857_42980 [Bradyrhizobium iriomotense]|uniref:Uncharacterized protein n=1 Tax=Bradyrhizobium iriomotense TaxID=441950 RepID=A0ABQ6B6A3_9BRAD|nr:hypothetical protein GCM10007857_42980 [Bradyrhizobium iriomotense]